MEFFFVRMEWNDFILQFLVFSHEVCSSLKQLLSHNILYRAKKKLIYPFYLLQLVTCTKRLKRWNYVNRPCCKPYANLMKILHGTVMGLLHFTALMALLQFNYISGVQT